MDTYSRIQLLMDAHNEKASDLSRATGISTGLLSQWKSRMQEPSTQKLSLIAAHYGVTVNYLVAGSDDPTEPFGGLDKVYFSIAKDAQENNIDPADLRAIINIVKKRKKEN